MAKKDVVVYNNQNEFVDSVWFKKMLQQMRHIIEEYKEGRVELESERNRIEIEARYKVGKMLVDNTENAGKLEPLIAQVAEMIGESERQLQYCIKAYKTYPDGLSGVLKDKSMTWGRLVKYNLTDGSKLPKEECKHKTTKRIVVEVCTTCGKRTKLDEEALIHDA